MKVCLGNKEKQTNLRDERNVILSYLLRLPVLYSSCVLILFNVFKMRSRDKSYEARP